MVKNNCESVKIFASVNRIGTDGVPKTKLLSVIFGSVHRAFVVGQHKEGPVIHFIGPIL